MNPDEIETVDELVTAFEESDSVERVWDPVINPDGPEGEDLAMSGREVITFRMWTAKPVDYSMSETLRKLGFRHEYTDTSLKGSKYNPNRVIRQWWSRKPEADE